MTEHELYFALLVAGIDLGVKLVLMGLVVLVVRAWNDRQSRRNFELLTGTVPSVPVVEPDDPEDYFGGEKARGYP